MRPKNQPVDPIMNVLHLELTAWQLEVARWQMDTFGSSLDVCSSMMLLTEEVGELARALLKQRQGIRGTSEQWQTEIKKEMGDVLVALAGVGSAADVTLGEALEDRWAAVSQRTMASQKEERLP